MITRRILVVDDEFDICEILKYNLEKSGFEVEIAPTAEEASQKSINTFDLILLDVMFGERMGGFTFARTLKSKPDMAAIPIIFITALGSEQDIISGLNMGADDYITKPFSIPEVISRVNAVLRRTIGEIHEISYETLVLDLDSMSAFVDGEDINLTKTEFGIIKLLLEKKEVVFSRDAILKEVWPNDVLVLDRTVDVNVTRLRKKLGRYGDKIVTRHGFGYTFLK